MATNNEKVIPENIISGLKVSKSVREKIKEEVEIIKSIQGKYINKLPRLDVIIVGDRKDSITYVNNKTKACDEVAILQQCHKIDASITQHELEDFVRKLNADDDVTAILIQLPLPEHLNSAPILELISPDKDADGLTTANFGLLFRDGASAPIIPCTPHGCLELLRHYNVKMTGANVVVIGRSFLVGRPVAILLQSENATVTMCHSKTRNLEGIIQSADIVIAAVGKPNFVKGSSIKKGAVVLDVGINVIPDDTKKSGHRLVGDVEFSSAQENARLITPVPGGVGPMTVAMLLRNTISAYYLQRSNEIIPILRSLKRVEFDLLPAFPTITVKHSWSKTHQYLESILEQALPHQIITSIIKKHGFNPDGEEEFEKVLAAIWG